LKTGLTHKSKLQCPCQNSNCFVQQHCSAEWMSILDDHKDIISYKIKQNIFNEGSPVKGLYFIFKGKVKVVTRGFSGNEKIIRLAGEGHILGHRGYGGETYPIGAVTLDETILCYINNEMIYEAFMANPKFTFGLMSFYSDELRKTEQRLKYISQMTVKEKVAEALTYMIDAFDMKPGSKGITAVLNRKEIAALVGTNAEQVSRIMSDFRNEGIIDFDKRIIIISDKNRLTNIVRKYDQHYLTGH
jgi:CRP-like cAMP-binding protein